MFGSITGDYYYNGKGVKMSFSSAWAGDNGWYSWDNNLPNLQKVFQDSYYLAMSGLILSGIALISMGVIVILKKCFPKILIRLLKLVIVVTSFLAVVADALAFGLFFRVTSAFNSDNSNALSYFAYTCSSPSACQKFMGSTDHTAWGPAAGFWLCMVAFVLVLVALIMVLRNPKRFKYTRLG